MFVFLWNSRINSLPAHPSLFFQDRSLECLEAGVRRGPFRGASSSGCVSVPVRVLVRWLLPELRALPRRHLCALGSLGPPRSVGSLDGLLRAGFSVKNFTLVTSIFLELALEVVVRLIDIQVCLFSFTSCFICINVRSRSLVISKTN